MNADDKAALSGLIEFERAILRQLEGWSEFLETVECIDLSKEFTKAQFGRVVKLRNLIFQLTQALESDIADAEKAD